MRPLGKVVNFSASGSIVIRSDRAPRIGITVVDRRSNPIGRIVRITGPVKAPYLIVKPHHDAESPLFRMLGKEVYEGTGDGIRRKGRGSSESRRRTDKGKDRGPKGKRPPVERRKG